MENSYPVLIIPESITEAKISDIPLPKEPDKFEKSNTGLYLIAIGFFMLFFLPVLGIIVSIIGVILIYINKSQGREYEEKLSFYSREKSIVLKKRENKDEVKKYRAQRLESALKKTEKAYIYYKNFKGKTEDSFFKILNKYFYGNIEIDKVIELFSNNKPYCPDFIYTNEVYNLHIDIEIDEPYVSGNGQPIHYIDENKYEFESDRLRNNYFIKKGWIVIRFAEEQIVKYPDECCKYIADVIKSIINQDISLPILENVTDLPKIKSWTKVEAEKMFINNYRDKYISEKLKENIIKLSKEIYNQAFIYFNEKAYQKAFDNLMKL